jgi:two-component system, chemotaxis family, CheB/CheR fusion protein
VASARSDASVHIRAWAAGCATGEEAYSMAMLLIEATAGTGASVQVFGTDIDEDAIAFARQGAYPAAVAADIPPSRVSRFLQKDDNTYRVSKQLREAVLFARHNVLQDPPFSKLDIISCRNLLIYLNRDIQSRVLETFHFALKPGGFLILGTSESADSVSRLFTPVDKKNRIYRANAAASSGVIVRRTAQPAAERDERVAEPLRVPPMLANRKHRSLRDVHDDALRDFLPPSILVDKDGVIVNMSDSASDYLRLSGGTPSLQINTLIVPELRLELRTSLFQAVQGGRAVRSRAVGWGGRDEGVSVSLEVRPIHDKDSDVTYYLVVFQQGSALALPQGAADPEETPILLQLEEELKRAKEQLQTTLEESEASSEELKASNEELQSINEELRSATEELETSKEELQSINEELITVNHELKLKVDETAKINDDLQNLVASTDIATVFVDRDMCVKGFTPQAAEVFRLIAGDVGRPLLDLNHRLDYPELAADATQAFHALRISEREVGSGDGRWYIARVLPYRTAQDRIEGAVLTFIDITRRHEAEIAARASEERMRLVADSALDYAIITMDPDGIITSWSRGAEKIFGYTGAEAMGQSGELIYTPEDRGAAVFSRELGVARGEGRAHDDRWHQRSDGERIFCSGITTPLHQGGFHGFAKIARDMTIEKQREREREELLRAEKASRERAQSAVQLKDEFLAVMSHELKHPLNLIMMNAELIGRSPSTQDDPGVRRLAGTIRKTVEGQARIIDDLLDLSRLNTGKMALTIVPVNVSECVRQVAEGMHEEMHRRRIQLHLTLPEQDLHMKADRIRVEQVVWNLLSNAVKFCKDEGHVIVTLAVAGARAVLTVADDGIGMAPDKIARVFNMFDQGASRRDGGTRGLGIGLALVKQLVELHGGEVDAHSDGPGRGATFTVSMPITEATAEAAPIEASAEPASTSLKGLSILIVDDSDELLGPFRQLLTMEGAEVSLASSGEAALERMGQQRFDVVLSDIGMPGMDGHELIRRIRASEHGDHVIAIAVTGFGRQQDATKAKAAGFDAHLSKPVSMRVLVETISSLRSN